MCLLNAFRLESLHSADYNTGIIGCLHCPVRTSVLADAGAANIAQRAPA